VEAFKSLLMELDRQLIAAPDAHIDARLAELQPAFQFLLLEFNVLMSTPNPCMCAPTSAPSCNANCCRIFHWPR